MDEKNKRYIWVFHEDEDRTYNLSVYHVKGEFGYCLSSSMSKDLGMTKKELAKMEEFPPFLIIASTGIFTSLWWQAYKAKAVALNIPIFIVATGDDQDYEGIRIFYSDRQCFETTISKEARREFFNKFGCLHCGR